MTYDLKILTKLISENRFKEFYYLAEDFVKDQSVQDPVFFNLVGIYFSKNKKREKSSYIF